MYNVSLICDYNFNIVFQIDVFDHVEQSKRSRHVNVDDHDHEMDSAGSASSSGGGAPYGQMQPRRSGAAPSRKTSSASVGPQYRYIDGERYVREDCLYTGPEDYRGEAHRPRGSTYTKRNDVQEEHGHQARLYQTYDYVTVDDDKESLYGHQVTNRRRSEPVHGMQWQNTGGKDRLNMTDELDDVFTYQVSL